MHTVILLSGTQMVMEILIIWSILWLSDTISYKSLSLQNLFFWGVGNNLSVWCHPYMNHYAITQNLAAMYNSCVFVDQIATTNYVLFTQ